MTWRAKFWLGAPLAILFIAILISLDAILLNWMINQSIRLENITFLTFLAGLVVLCSLPAMLYLGYQGWSSLTLRYHLDRNGIRVRWAGTEMTIPIRSIQRIVPGNTLKDDNIRRTGLRWPGHERGTGRIPSLGRTRFLSTRSLDEQLLIVTTNHVVAISPSQPEAFLAAYLSRTELGPNRILDSGTEHAQVLSWPLWRDQTAWLLVGAALIINLALFGFLCARFANLDLQLPLHFNRQGMVDRIGTRSELFALPIIGLIVLGTNTVLGLGLYKWERAGSYLLWGGAAAAQALFWLATISILP